MKIRDAAQLQTFDQFVLDVSGGMLQGLDRVGLFLRVFRPDAYVHPRVLHVRLHADFADADVSFKAGVFQFADEHGVQFVSDFFADP